MPVPNFEIWPLALNGRNWTQRPTAVRQQGLQLTICGHLRKCYPKYGNLLFKAGEDSEDRRLYRRNCFTVSLSDFLRRIMYCRYCTLGAFQRLFGLSRFQIWMAPCESQAVPALCHLARADDRMDGTGGF
jgi:hypothetical protein